MRCSECGEEFDAPALRPYGKDGASICFPCGMRPENVERTHRTYLERLDVAAAADPDGVVVLTTDGPEPLASGKALFELVRGVLVQRRDS